MNITTAKTNCSKSKSVIGTIACCALIIYGGSGSRISVITDNESGYSLNLTYSGDGNIKSWTEKDGTTAGMSVTVVSRTAKGVDYQVAGRTDSAEKRHVIYLFDFAGRTVNAYVRGADDNLIYSASVGEYTEDSGQSRKTNRLAAQASAGLTSPNLLTNGGFELGNTGYTMAIPGVNQASAGISSGAFRTGQKGFNISDSGSVNAGIKFTAPSLTVGETYTLSAYVNTSSVTSFGGGVYLSANGEESTHVTYKTASSIDDGWTRIAVSFVATSSNALYFYCDRIHGSVHLDDVQLELGEAPAARTFWQTEPRMPLPAGPW